jgi:serine/threonine protein phosphatase PrpC
VLKKFKQVFVKKNRKGRKARHEDDHSRGKETVAELFSPIFDVASCQSSGIERMHNEDVIFTFVSHLSGFDTPSAFGLFLVADGMGGHQSGEVASRLAAQGASQYILDQFYKSYLFDEQDFRDEEIKIIMQNAVDAAQKLIMRHVPGGGTTLTMVLALGHRLFSAHVGDSRLYILGLDGRLRLRTKDHSLVRRLVELGEITKQEAHHHNQRNVLTRALGQVEPFVPDLDQFSLEKGERIMICSDGLWGVLDEQELFKIINQHQSLEKITCDLVKEANKHGGPDNISVILVERKN